MLRELGILLASEQRRLLGEFQERQRAFVEPEIVSARAELEGWIDRRPSGHLRDRSDAFARASLDDRRPD